MATKLTVKQKKFVKAYVATDGNGQEAAKLSYNVSNDNSARQLASQNLTKPNIRAAIEQSLIKHELTIDSAIAPIKEGLLADKVSISGQGEQAFAEVTPDHSVRLKASSMLLKLLGADARDELLTPSIHFHQHIQEKKAEYDL